MDDQQLAVANVRLGGCPRFVLIDQDDFSADAPHDEGVGGCRADQAASDDSDFHGFPPAQQPLQSPARALGLDTLDRNRILFDAS